MVRHVFMGVIADGVKDEDVERLLGRWRELATLIPGVRSLQAGRNLSTRQSAYTPGLALVADFDDREAWQVYMDHPAHKAVTAEVSGWVIVPESRTFVLYEW